MTTKTLGPFGDTSAPAPHIAHWVLGLTAALAVHGAVAWPFLPKPQPALLGVGDIAAEGIPVSLAPPPIAMPPAPPEPEVVEPEPEPEPVIEERAENAPPPAAPAVPRERPELPAISPQAIPDVWIGGGGTGGDLSLDEYLTLREWLAEARATLSGRLNYPVEARKRRIGGTAEVIITVDRRGRISDWSLNRSTGHLILDGEIRSTVRSIRRMPALPDASPHDQLSFTVPIRFEIIYDDAAAAGPVPAAPQTSDAAPAEGGLSRAELGACAGSAAQLSDARAEILALQDALVAQREAYETAATRAQRFGDGDNPRLRRQLREYEAGVADYDARLNAFNARASDFSARCQGGRAEWEDFAAACAPYARAGNGYCEAFGPFWGRLRAEAGAL